MSVWFSREAWPLYVDEPFPHATTTEAGHHVEIDVAREGEPLCAETCITLHPVWVRGELEQERRLTFCIMPPGHDTPHMPQDERSIETIGRLVVRRFSDPVGV